MKRWKFEKMKNTSYRVKQTINIGQKAKRLEGICFTVFFSLMSL